MAIKVLYLAPPRTSADRLTAFTFVDEEIVMLGRAGVEVFVLSYPVASDSRDASHSGVYLRELPSGKSMREFFSTLRFLWKARRLVPPANWLRLRALYHTARTERFAADVIRAENIDLVHSQFGWPDGYGGVLATTVTGRPLVATMRGMDVLVDRELDYGLRTRRRSYDRALRLLLRNADRTTHVSEFIRRKAIELGGRSSSAITIRKGVDCDHFRRRADSQEPKAKPMILTVAGLIERKGIDYILRALGLLVDSHDFIFVVVGRGPEMNNLQALCGELGLQSRTRFEGYVPRDQIQQRFSACDIFVLGSIWEGSGNVLLEALASGCPVVCTDSGGPPEYIADGETGFVVPPRDPGAMADKIRVLLDDSELREKLGREARAHAEQRFRYSRMIDDIVGVYRGVTAGQPIDTAGRSLGAQ